MALQRQVGVSLRSGSGAAPLPRSSFLSDQSDHPLPGCTFPASRFFPTAELFQLSVQYPLIIPNAAPLRTLSRPFVPPGTFLLTVVLFQRLHVIGFPLIVVFLGASSRPLPDFLAPLHLFPPPGCHIVNRKWYKSRRGPQALASHIGCTSCNQLRLLGLFISLASQEEIRAA